MFKDIYNHIKEEPKEYFSNLLALTACLSGAVALMSAVLLIAELVK